MNIYEQAAEQAKIDRQQQMLNKKVEYDLLKSHENRLLERLDELGIKYEKRHCYKFNEEHFLAHIHNGCTIEYDIYLYPEKVKDKWGQMSYLTEEVILNRSGTYKFGRLSYSKESGDLDKIMEAITEKVISMTKYYTKL